MKFRACFEVYSQVTIGMRVLQEWPLIKGKLMNQWDSSFAAITLKTAIPQYHVYPFQNCICISDVALKKYIFLNLIIL